MRISDWSADVCSSDLLQQQAISCLTGRQTRLAHMVSDLIRVGPEAAIAGSGRIDDVDVPAADKGVSLGVQDLEHADVEMPRCKPRLHDAQPAGPAGHQVGWIQAAGTEDVLHAFQV